MQRPEDTPNLLKDPVVADIAAKHGKNVGQVRSSTHAVLFAKHACMLAMQASDFSVWDLGGTKGHGTAHPEHFFSCTCSV